MPRFARRYVCRGMGGFWPFTQIQTRRMITRERMTPIMRDQAGSDAGTRGGCNAGSRRPYRVLLLVLLLTSIALLTSQAAEYDVLIRNGLVYDGSGKSPFRADVAVT